jgi:uncharacterized protein (DUF362 family)
MSEIVHVIKTSYRTLRSDVGRALSTTEFKKLNPDKETFIKINANYDRNWPGCNTSKWFLEALLSNLREIGFSELKVVEGDLKFQPASRTIKVTGINKVLEKYNVPFVALEGMLRDNELPILLKNSQLISTPVLHTHTFAVISVAAKNLYGLLPVFREKYHNVLSQKLLDLCKNTKVFSIVDGTVGLQGGSMRMGDPIKTDLILTGWDPISLDVVAAQIMGFDLVQIPHLKLATDQGLTKDIFITGDFSEEELPRYHFTCKTPSIANFDLWVRKNNLIGRFFKYNSPLDCLANITRRNYTKIIYYSKIKKISKGDWKCYEDGELY